MIKTIQISDAELAEIAAGWPEDFRVFPRHDGYGATVRPSLVESRKHTTDPSKSR